jgi:hypothetical protein
MSAQYEHETFLRAALHAAADTLDPRADGLNLIRARLNRSRPVVLLRARAMWNEMFMRAPAALQDGGYWLASTIRDACVRFDRAITPGRHRSRAQSWLRPIAVMAVTLFIVAAGTYAAITTSNFIFPSTSGAQSNSGTSTGGNTGGPAPGTSVTHSYAPPRSGRSSPAASCSAAATASPAPAASPANSPQVSPSPSPSATPTDTSTSTDATPTDTSTGSPGPTDSASATPTQSVEPTVPPATPAAQATPCTTS